MDGFDPNFRPPAGLGEPDEEIKIESKESIKIIKNSKGWNFEVKIVDKENIEPQMDRLDRILKRLQEKYPNDK
jgi:hypothetical protein